MNRNFNILWFEDERMWFNSAKRKVEEIIEEHCLIPKITRKVGGDYDESEICSNIYDLLLVDYKLHSGETGEKIIAKIRQHQILTDTLFYSSDENNMIAAVQQVSPPIDGIYYTKRDTAIFSEKVNGLINKIVKRSENLVNLRGFVLDDSCDFEVRVKELLNIAWNKFSDEQRDILEDDVLRHIDDPMQRFEKNKYRIMKEKPYYPRVVNDTHFFQHTDRLYLLTKVIQILKDSYGFLPKEQHSNFKCCYEKDISCYRNALGHKKLKDSYIEIAGEQIHINEELHKKMRNTLTEYDSLIYDLEEYLAEKI